VGGIIDAMREPMGLDSYAAAIAATDLLISVDTLAAHCAGAMGHPVRVALPATPEWRWGRDATTTPWYASATLFRQAADQSWDEVVAGLCAVGA
jgi:ADP-heptose:LPS heptosyltransferase